MAPFVIPQQMLAVLANARKFAVRKMQDACLNPNIALSFANNATLCRASIDEACDTPEYCSGNSRSCPADQTAEDGTGCGNGLACASGQCTSNDRESPQSKSG